MQRHLLDDDEVLAPVVVQPSGSDLEKVPQRQVRRQSTGFVRLPLQWKGRLTKARHAATLKLAHELLFESWRSGCATLTVSNMMMERAGLTRYAKSRALAELVSLGLLTTDCRGKRAPRVTLWFD